MFASIMPAILVSLISMDPVSAGEGDAGAKAIRSAIEMTQADLDLAIAGGDRARAAEARESLILLENRLSSTLHGDLDVGEIGPDRMPVIPAQKIAP